MESYADLKKLENLAIKAIVLKSLIFKRGERKKK